MERNRSKIINYLVFFSFFFSLVVFSVTLMNNVDRADVSLSGQAMASGTNGVVGSSTGNNYFVQQPARQTLIVPSQDCDYSAWHYEGDIIRIMTDSGLIGQTPTNTQGIGPQNTLVGWLEIEVVLVWPYPRALGRFIGPFVWIADSGRIRYYFEGKEKELQDGSKLTVEKIEGQPFQGGAHRAKLCWRR